MKNKFNGILALLIAIVLLSVAVTASMLIPANENAQDNSQGPENSPVIDENWDLVRVDFIHYAKPPSTQAGNTNGCYKLLGVKWKTFPVNYVINPSNPQNLSEAFVTSAIAISAETWDAATSRELFNNSYTVNYSAVYGVRNFQNAIVFGDYPNSNVIAVTSVWYSPIQKKIVEYDMLLNTDFPWGNATSNITKMDLQNIVTHEKGHGIGLADIYSSTCTEVTMFGYADYGETKKRTLEQPDITGTQRMYGA